MIFLCDEMLGGLARWLRAAGYDAAMDRPGRLDRELVARARAENRLFLTRDRAILAHRASSGRVLLLAGHGLDDWAREMRERAGVDWLRRPFSRCLLCNEALTGHRALPELYSTCPSCGRLYWPGSHVRRMTARLAEWSRLT
jgi:hypothetical protein